MNTNIQNGSNITIDDLAVMIKKGFDEMDRRFSEIDQRFIAVDKRFDNLEDRMYKLEVRFDKLEKRFNNLEIRLDKLEKRFDVLEKRFDHFEVRFDVFEDKFDRLSDEVSKNHSVRLKKIERQLAISQISGYLSQFHISYCYLACMSLSKPPSMLKFLYAIQ